MSATQHCPLCGGSTFRAVDGHPGMHIICECTQPDLEDTPEQRGFAEGFLAGYKSGRADGEASARRQIEERSDTEFPQGKTEA